MAEKSTKLAELDPVWRELVAEAKTMVENEPLVGSMVHSSVLHHEVLENALAYRFSLKLSSEEMPAQIMREIADKT